MKKVLRLLYRYFVNNTIFPYFRMLMTHKLRNIASMATGKLLDIGCGNQPYRNLFKNVAEYIGTNSEKYYSANYFSKMKTDYIVEDGCNLPFGDREFEFVTNFQVLPVFSDPSCFLQEVKRVLKDGGVFIITTDFMYPIWNAPYNYVRFTQYGLEELARQNGFDILYLDNFGGYWSMRARNKEKYIKDMPAILLQKISKNQGILSKMYLLLSLILFLPLLLILPIYLNLSFVIYHYLDKIFYNPDFTTNYILVLRKK